MDHPLKPGDLVKYSRNPKAIVPRVIPTDSDPVGVVIDVTKKLVGQDPESMCYMSTVHVMWADPRWNLDKGFSEEYYNDLVVIQSVKG